MAKKKQLDPENNQNVETPGDEPLKVVETTQTAQNNESAIESSEEVPTVTQGKEIEELLAEDLKPIQVEVTPDLTTPEIQCEEIPEVEGQPSFEEQDPTCTKLKTESLPEVSDLEKPNEDGLGEVVEIPVLETVAHPVELTEENLKEEISVDVLLIEPDESSEGSHEDDSEVSKSTSYGMGSEDDISAKFAHLTREELVESIETLVKNEDINYIRNKIGFIKVAYHKLTRLEREKLAEQSVVSGEELSDGSDLEADNLDPLKIRFDEAFKIYKSKKSEFDQALESQKGENLVAKEAILEELRQLIDSEEELKKTYDQFRDLQERWRHIGAVPQLAKNNLWNNYHFLIEKFFDKVKINKELKDLDLKKNLELKTELCEKAEELLLETSIVVSFQKLQKLHETWKETGPVANDKKDDIWDRFRAATVRLNQRREEHYQGLSQEQEKNFAAKLVLCEKAEQIAEIVVDNPRKWQELTTELNEIFKVWKTIGFAPKKVNNEIWNRFRTALNTFFKNKKEYLDRFKDVQNENYNQKLNLCIQAEALKDSTDWSKATNEFISLQNQWKVIGQVPPKFSDKIWKRFRTACDDFFKSKSEFFANIDQTQDKNLSLKKELIEKIKNHPYTNDNTNNLKVLNEFQRQWMEIGHVPIKQKDKVHTEFRNAVDEKFEALGISRKAKTAMSFRNKLDNLKANPNADNIIYKERTYLLNKISQLQNDINLWENNIGFFASSKKADLLKKEFEDKIEKGKQEIAIMEEKLKILREQ